MKYFEITSLPIINFPVITRWVTFLECCKYIFENFDLIKLFIESLDHSEYRELIDFSNLLELYNKLKTISSYIYISHAIKVLERKNNTFFEQMEVIEDVGQKITDENLSRRFNEILSKNPDFNNLKNMIKYKDIVLDEKILYLGLISVSFKRSFNYLRLIINDNRRSLKSKNLFLYMSTMINDHIE